MLLFFLNWKYFPESKNKRNTNLLLSKSFFKISSLSPSMLSRSTASPRPVHIYMDVGLKNSVLSFFRFWLWINDKTIKIPGFYDNAHLHICSICLRLNVSWLNRNSVFADRTKRKGSTCQWKHDAYILLSVEIHQMNKVDLMGYRK